MKKVLVLCTGNSCRSQMLEGVLRHSGIDVQSAGLESDGLNPYAVKVMNELNIDISKNISKKINTLDINSFDILITVCDHAKNLVQTLHKLRSRFTNPLWIQYFL